MRLSLCSLPSQGQSESRLDLKEPMMNTQLAFSIKCMSPCKSVTATYVRTLPVCGRHLVACTGCRSTYLI